MSLSENPKPCHCEAFFAEAIPCIMTEITSSQKTLLAMTVPDALADKHYLADFLQFHQVKSQSPKASKFLMLIRK